MISYTCVKCSLQVFLTQLVCNLLDEGNACFREGDWRQATQQYSEGISVARYAQSEALIIPHELLESLYVNRAAAFYQAVSGLWSFYDTFWALPIIWHSVTWIFYVNFFLICLFFHSRENMNEASRTVTVRCASQMAAAGLCSVRLCVWGRRDDLGMRMSVSLNVFSLHHK